MKILNESIPLPNVGLLAPTGALDVGIWYLCLSVCLSVYLIDSTQLCKSFQTVQLSQEGWGKGVGINQASKQVGNEASRQAIRGQASRPAKSRQAENHASKQART